jgi:hypothetical protein
MALVRANEKAVLEASICLPRTGPWHVEFAVDTEEDLADPVTISIADGRLVLVGSVARGGTFVDAARARVVAGAAGLGTIATPRHYTSTSLRIVLVDLLDMAGERLADTADAATLALQVDAWTTTARPVGTLISELLSSAAPETTWRALVDGTIWVGPETWPDSGLVEADYQVLGEDPAAGTAMLGVEVPTLLPGVTLAGRRVSDVELYVGSSGVRTRVMYEDVGAGGDRLKQAIASMVRGAMSPGATGPVDHRACYFAKVVSQVGDFVDVEPDDDRLPPMARVPLLLGLPGASVNGSAAGRVLVGWAAGDPAHPYAMGWDFETLASKVVLTADQIYIGGESGAQPSVMGTTLKQFLEQLVAALNAPHAHGGASPAPVTFGLTLPNILASSAKVR